MPHPGPRPGACDAAIAGRLAQVWRDLFGGQTLAHDDNLFEAGASSFDVVRFVDAAQAAGLPLSIADVFDTPHFAMKGGTAINLFIEDMPRLTVDIDVVFLPRRN